MEAIQVLRDALNGVPVTLLAADDARVYEDVAFTLTIVERSSVRARCVVLVGPSGSGKSFVFNSIVGSGSSPEGVIRPTTVDIVTTTNPPEMLVRREPGLVALPVSADGFEVVDTPAWESDPSAVLHALDAADLAVLVISPIRYADASVAELWEKFDAPASAIILNRTVSDGGEHFDLVRSVTDLYEVEPYVISEGGAELSGIGEFLDSALPDREGDPMHTIMVHTAAAGARYVVRAVTNAAPDIGKVSSAVDGLGDCEIDVAQFAVQDSWEGTRDGIVESMARLIRDRDDDVVRGSGTELAERIVDALGECDESVIAEALDMWQVRCIERFTDAASIRWRRSSALQLIERFSWSTSINPSIVSPKRFTRLMAHDGGGATVEMRSQIESLLCGFVDARVAAWHSMLDELGGFQPGQLAEAADALQADG